MDSLQLKIDAEAWIEKARFSTACMKILDGLETLQSLGLTKGEITEAIKLQLEQNFSKDEALTK